MTCLIRYKGENVSTTEVAAVLGGFTDLRVAQCVVYVGCFWREYSPLGWPLMATDCHSLLLARVLAPRMASLMAADDGRIECL